VALAIAMVTGVVRLHGTPAQRRAACCPCASKWGWFLEHVHEVAPGIAIHGRLGLFRAPMLP